MGSRDALYARGTSRNRELLSKSWRHRASDIGVHYYCYRCDRDNSSDGSAEEVCSSQSERGWPLVLLSEMLSTRVPEGDCILPERG